jgi:hypothetical protein
LNACRLEPKASGILWVSSRKSAHGVLTGVPSDHAQPGLKLMPNYRKLPLYRSIIGPEGSKKLSLPDFNTIGTQTETKLSAVLSGHFYPHPKEIVLVLISVRGSFDPQRYSAAGRITSMKNSKTLPGIEPATFWLLAPCLNRRYSVPPYLLKQVTIFCEFDIQRTVHRDIFLY